jgi:crotonobetainyl-CoA:carnitine CoA-transferase CaiB-like acyl-CoA transferase
MTPPTEQVGLLDGLRVVEVALLAPNMLGMHLADLGADVVKVEDLDRGDYTRAVGFARAGGLSMLHLRWNRGKRSVAIDLRTPQGADVFTDLVRVSEVVIEGQRPGALARRGLSFDALRAVNPAVVLCSLSGFGQTGPYRDLATHGVAYDAFAGLAPPARTEDGFPTIPRGSIDVGTQAGALYAAMAMLAAVLRARATGHGAHLDVAQADAAVAWQAGRLDLVLNDVQREGGDLHESVRYQYYDTSDGRVVLFQASEQHFFERFCRAVGREDLLDRRADAQVGEHAAGDLALRRQLAAIFATRTQAEWVQLFRDADVAGGPVHDVRSLLTDPQFMARTALVEHDHADAGRLRMVGTPVHTGEPPVAPRPAPARGQDTDAALRDLLGYDASAIADLRGRGVIA